MKIETNLPLKYEKKWDRISAYLGKDIDALLIAGIDYMWNNFGNDIQQNERQTARYARKTKQAELSMSLLPTKVCGSFVGSFMRKGNAKGVIRLPKCWLVAMGNRNQLYCLRHGKQSIYLFAENEFVKCDESVKRKAVALLVSSSGCVKIDGVVRGFSCANRTVVLRGQMRYVQVSAAPQSPRGISHIA